MPAWSILYKVGTRLSLSLSELLKYLTVSVYGWWWYLETKRQLHAKEVVQSLDLAKYDGIVCVSGDGILVEVGQYIYGGIFIDVSH